MDTNIASAALCRHLLPLVLSPVLIAFVHALAARLNGLKRSPYSNQAVCILSVFVALPPLLLLLSLFGLFGLGNGSILPAALYSAVVYLALGYTYFHFFNMSETARRIRLLYEIGSGSFTVTDDSVAGPEPVRRSLTTRLERLEGLGQIEQSGGGDGRYLLKGRTMLFGARIVRLWGLLLGIDILAQR